MLTSRLLQSENSCKPFHVYCKVVMMQPSLQCRYVPPMPILPFAVHPLSSYLRSAHLIDPLTSNSLELTFRKTDLLLSGLLCPKHLSRSSRNIAPVKTFDQHSLQNLADVTGAQWAYDGCSLIVSHTGGFAVVTRSDNSPHSRSNVSEDWMVCPSPPIHVA